MNACSKSQSRPQKDKSRSGASWLILNVYPDAERSQSPKMSVSLRNPDIVVSTLKRATAKWIEYGVRLRVYIQSRDIFEVSSFPCRMPCVAAASIED